MPGMVMDDGPPFDEDEEDATHDELDEDDGRLTPARTEEVIFTSFRLIFRFRRPDQATCDAQEMNSRRTKIGAAPKKLSNFVNCQFACCPLSLGPRFDQAADFFSDFTSSATRVTRTEVTERHQFSFNFPSDRQPNSNSPKCHPKVEPVTNRVATEVDKKVSARWRWRRWASCFFFVPFGGPRCGHCDV